MTPAQIAHCERIANDAASRIRAKYATGQREHGGNLWDKFTPLQLIEEALAEAVDQVIYLETLRYMIADITAKRERS